MTDSSHSNPCAAIIVSDGQTRSLELSAPSFNKYISKQESEQQSAVRTSAGEYRCFFVLERPDPMTNVARLVDTLNRLLEHVLERDLDICFRTSIGTTCQVAHTATRVQLVYDLLIPNNLLMLTLATRMENRAQEQRTGPDGYEDLFFHAKSPFGDMLVETCAINKDVYCGAHIDLPMLYSTPREYSAPLKPFSTSSTCAMDHIIHPAAITQTHGQQTHGVVRITKRHCMFFTKIPTQETSMSRQLTTAESTRFIDYMSEWDQCQTLFKTEQLKLAEMGRSTLESNNVTTGLLAPGTLCPYSLDTKCTSVCIEYHKQKKRAYVSCYSEPCRQRIAQQGYLSVCEEDTEIGIHDRCFGTKTLHTQQDNIVWNERYDEPEMKQLTIKPLVCVRAGMGLGKTIALKNMLEANIKFDTKVLVVTFSRNLASKLHADMNTARSKDPQGSEQPSLTKHEFVNYQNVKGPLNHSRIVVCLDSLDRVTTRNFNYIIVDEAVSVFLHFNSECMRKASLKTDLLELMVRQAEHVYFVDAAVDMTFMKKIVDYFATAKMVVPYWIWNEHVRASDTTCHLVVSKQEGQNKKEESDLMMNCANRVLDLLREGKRVVACSSLKKFATVLSEYIAEQSPVTRVSLYTSETNNSDLKDVNAAWVKCDLLVYSPSVSAGVSFTVPHFDVLVGFLVNAHYAPSVDIAIQQLYRVRILMDKTMYLYVNDTQSHKLLPWSAEDLDIQLRQSVAVANSYCDPKSTIFYDAQLTVGDVVKYDPDRMSYHVITGIMSTQNRSAMYYTEILTNTLRLDYGVEVCDTILPRTVEPEDVLAMQEALLTTIVPPFYHITQLDAKSAARLKESIETATTTEKAAIRLYDFQTLYNLTDDAVDSHFYSEYAMPVSAITTYFQIKRFRALRYRSLEENLREMGVKLKGIIALKDPSMEYYKSRALANSTKLVLAQELCNELLPTVNTAELKEFGTTRIECTEEQLSSTLERFFKNHKREDVLKVYGLRVAKSGFSLLSGILRVAFKMDVVRGARRKTRPRYNELTLSCNAEHEINRYATCSEVE